MNTTDKCCRLSEIKYYLLDMDGTIYLGNRLIEGAKLLLKTIRNKGCKAVFLTNNSSNEPHGYAEKLRLLGLDVDAQDVFTSGDAAAETVLELSGIKNPGIFLLGTPELHRQFEKSGIRIVNSTAQKPDYVILGFDKTLTYDKIEKAYRYIANGTPFLATHPDLLCPTEDGYIPDTGSMIKMFEAATGVTPMIIGKPENAMARAVARKYAFDTGKTAMVGDRLTTDIMFANNAGLCAVLVLSGETDRDMYNNQKSVRADYIFDSVQDLAYAIQNEE